MIRRSINRFVGSIFGSRFNDGVRFAADLSDQEIEDILDMSAKAGRYGDLERGMSWCLDQRQDERDVRDAV